MLLIIFRLRFQQSSHLCFHSTLSLLQPYQQSQPKTFVQKCKRNQSRKKEGKKADKDFLPFFFSGLNFRTHKFMERIFG